MRPNLDLVNESVCLPDSSVVEQHTAHKRKHCVWQRVDRVKGVHLKLREVVRRLFDDRCDRRDIVVAEVAAHEE
jgi:hypothetical protein